MTDDNVSYSALSMELDRTIEHLRAKEGVLASERMSLKELASDISESAEHTIVSIGDGYFVSMNHTDATSFLSRRDKYLEKSIDDIHSKIDFAEQMKVKLTAPGNGNEKEEKLNEEGLPFVEIVEELDANGNVISSNIGVPKERNSSIRIPEDSKVAEIQENTSGQSEATEVRTNESKETNSREDKEKDEWQELMEDMGITEVKDSKESPSSSRQSHEKDTSVPFEEDKSGSTSRSELAINENDMIKLELFDELADEEVDIPDNMEWDYDFEEGSSDDADDSLADEMLYGSRKTQFLPGKKNEENTINKMLWDKISDLRINKERAGNVTTVEDIQKESISSSKKSVRFSDALDIKSIENVGEQLKNITYPDRKLSKFKQNRVAIDRNTLPEDGPPKSHHQETTEPLSDIIERDVPVGSLHNSEKSHMSPLEVEDAHNAQETNNVTTNGTNKFDLDAMAKAYTRELNEEDRGAGSIVVEKLDDFEKVNALIMSSQNSGTLMNETYNEESTEQSYDDDGSDIDVDSDSGPILEEEIVENNDVTSEEIESSLLQEQINREYQYLSQKLRASSPKDNEPSEMVPLDENMQPVRISRFKSTRNKRYPRD
ncbi:hypothetical protein PGUG_02596 [Meyerozyma guilliermondii ATCC 6260]|uniref:DUF3835 domain-containing protein n=1 Tax=Meyerozyma guilliermondii (strain ATCC 6260 / CBS 566 / DSM 6381 / JCM 1539 / NBRC 10279 / NRRL Y-324) TaxID=294746 RepID=A5DH45_PICGU|nr:uncharacterized protein PGUG_02596 [Meyerozyma guilliermondii ATCC 6260]EDK38498.2 hypothetical protein PGUG_02596 [Meyerozyma guilliermondii ATCC 6260]